MKKLLMLIAMVVMGFTVMAQNPTISYQAVVRDANNRLVTSGTVDVTVNILNSSDVSQYSETHNSVAPNANGLISLTIGSVDPATFLLVDWNGAKIRTTVTIGSDPAVTNTVPVTAVPVSLKAVSASSVDPSVLEPYATKAKVHDDSLVLRTRINTNTTNITTNATNIAANKQLIKDTLSNYFLKSEVRNEIKDTANKLRDEIKGAGLATLEKVKADSTMLHDLIKDTLSNYYKKTETFTKEEVRSEIHDTANVLRDEMTLTHAQKVDSVEKFINESSTTDMYRLLGALENNPALWTQWSDTLASLYATYIRDAFKSSSEEHLISLLKAHAATLTTSELENYQKHLKEIYLSVNTTFRETVKDSIIKRIFNEVKNNPSITSRVKTVFLEYLSDASFKSSLLSAMNVESIISSYVSNPSNASTLFNAVKPSIEAYITSTDGKAKIKEALQSAGVLPNRVTLTDLGGGKFSVVWSWE